MSSPPQMMSCRHAVVPCSFSVVQLNIVIKEGDRADYPYCMMVLSSRRTRAAPSAMDSISSSPGYM
jgi:hypothetical protein